MVTTSSGILFWAAEVVGIKGGGGPKGVAALDTCTCTIGVTVIGTVICFEGPDLVSVLSECADVSLEAPAFSRNFLKYSLAALIFIR